MEELNETNSPKEALSLITDGEDNHSRYIVRNVKEFLKEQDVQYSAIGITSAVLRNTSTISTFSRMSRSDA